MYSQTILVCLVLSAIPFQLTDGATPPATQAPQANLTSNTTLPSTTPGGVNKTPAITTKPTVLPASGNLTQKVSGATQPTVSITTVGGTKSPGATPGPTSNTTKTPGNYGDTIHFPSYVTMTLTVCTSLYGLARQMY